MAQNQNVNIKATVSVDDSGVKKYNETLDQTEKKTEAAFNPKRALREANVELIKAQQNFGTYSAEAVKAAKKVADLRDQIQDANETAALFDPGKKFAAYSNALQSVAGAFAGVQGAIGLLGVESQEVEKQLLKVQSALALSEGLSTIGDIGKNFREVSTIIKTQAVGAFNALKAAIGSTGIGLLVVALGTIVAYWDDIKEAVTGVSEEQKKLNKQTEDNVKAQKEKLDEIGAQENILKLQGKSERDILQLKVKQTQQVIEATKQQINANIATLEAQVQAEKRNKEILKGILDFLVAPSQLVIDLISKAAKVFGVEFEFNIAEKVSKFIFDPDKVAAEGQAAIDEQKKALKKLEDQQAGFQLSIQQIDKQAADEAARKRKEALDKQLKEEEEAFKKRKELAEKNIKDIAALNSKNAENQSVNIKQQINDENAIQALIPKRIEAVTQVAQSEEQLANIRRDNAVADIILEDKKQAQFQENAAKTAEGLGFIANAFGKQTAVGKAAAISEATINTYLGAQKAYASLSGIPIVGPGLGIAAAAAAIIAGLKNVREIAKTKTPGGAAGGAVPSISAPTAAAPLAPQLPQATTTQLDQQSINQLATANTTTRAYVVESDVSSSQDRIRNINRAATFG